MDFNPRLREGGDEFNATIDSLVDISIHASAKEATATVAPHFATDSNFNPRLREGGDRNIL